MVTFFNESQKEFASPENTAMGRVVAALIQSDIIPASRRELEAIDDPRMKVYNRKPFILKTPKYAR